ncbi:Zinc finger protein Gfi-1 [Colletotrichum sp. SAR 10_66]|nr:Zinc finger protein Gfi-1 [Colletotrichum sp. SAR 10_66]
MSDFLSSTEFDKFLAELDSDAYAIDMGFMDLLDPIGYDDGHVGDGGLGPAAPLDPGYHKFEAEEKLGDILPSRRGKYGIPPVCPYPGCEFHRGDLFKDLSVEEQRSTKPFSTQAEYTKHMKEAHDFTPFPCNVAGCIKTGKKGYSREKDLINHRKKEHSEAAPYVPKPRDVRIACRFPGCGALMAPNSVSYHLHNRKSWF